MVTATLDAEAKLRAYGIHVVTTLAMPDDLRKFIDQVVKAPREPSSPAAKLLYDLQPAAAGENESTAIIILAPYLLFTAEKLGGERHVKAAFHTPLSSEYLPDAIRPQTVGRWSKLSSSIPDTAVGYIPAKQGSECNVPFPFTKAEELVLVSSTPQPSILWH